MGVIFIILKSADAIWPNATMISVLIWVYIYIYRVQSGNPRQSSVTQWRSAGGKQASSCISSGTTVSILTLSAPKCGEKLGKLDQSFFLLENR